MKEVLDWIKCVFVLVAIFGGFITCFVLAVYVRVKDIQELMGFKNDNSSRNFTMRCVGRKPSECKNKWFTVDEEYNVTDSNVFDDQGFRWYVFKYDNMFYEAGGYLFAKIENEK